MSIINSIINYFKGSYRELHKVSWPSRKEVTYLTIIVIIIIIISIIILGGIDFGLSEIVNIFVK